MTTLIYFGVTLTVEKLRAGGIQGFLLPFISESSAFLSAT
jgi:hypothetical protein